MAKPKHSRPKRTLAPSQLNRCKAAVPADAPLYINRELSILQFFWRVLEEARDESTPFLERVKLLSIVGSNLAEFYMVRVAGIRNKLTLAWQN